MSARPDFETLGRSTYWPAEDWQQAWSILVSDERTELWATVVDLGPYSRPTTAATALLNALHGEHDATHPSERMGT